MHSSLGYFRRLCWLGLAFTGMVFALSCSNGEGEQTQASPSAETSETEEASSSLELPPVYTTFSGIEDLFNKQTDSTYVINFWATWCKPCVEELPYIEQLHEDFGEEKLAITLVSLDFPNQLESKLLPFLEERQLQSEVVVLLDEDYNTWLDKVDPSWGGAIPVTVIYNAEKRVFIERQFESYAELREIVEAYL